MEGGAAVPGVADVGEGAVMSKVTTGGSGLDARGSSKTAPER